MILGLKIKILVFCTKRLKQQTIQTTICIFVVEIKCVVSLSKVSAFDVLGPLVAAFVNKWGCRKVGIVGSLISAFAFIISTFSPNIFVFQMTYGIIGGKYLFIEL